MEFSNNRSVSSNKEVFNPINELYDGGMSKLMTMMSVAVTFSVGAFLGIILYICIMYNFKSVCVCVCKLAWGHSNFSFRNFSSCCHSEREGFIFPPFFQTGESRHFPRYPQPHAPQPWSLTWHLRGLW